MTKVDKYIDALLMFSLVNLTEDNLDSTMDELDALWWDMSPEEQEEAEIRVRAGIKEDQEVPKAPESLGLVDTEEFPHRKPG